MSLQKVVDASGTIQYRVWLHKPTARLGIGLPGTWLGDLWFFEDYDPKETLNQSFCNFLDDPRDELSLPSKEFIDLGEL